MRIRDRDWRVDDQSISGHAVASGVLSLFWVSLRSLTLTIYVTVVVTDAGSSRTYRRVVYVVCMSGRLGFPFP